MQDERRMEKMLGIEGLVSPRERMMNAGSWVSDFLWPIAEMTKLSKWPLIAANLVGWGLYGIMGLYVWRMLKRGEWLWMGVVLYMVVLSFAWGQPVGRYMVPIAPLLMLGLMQGFLRLGMKTREEPGRDRIPAVVGRLARPALGVVLATTLLCNLPALGLVVSVIHSKDFAGRYLAGQYAELNGYARYLQGQNLRDDEVALNYGFGEGRRGWASPFVVRSLHLMLDRTLMTVGREQCNGEPNAKLLEWARANKVKIRFYFLRPEAQPKRFWHIRGDLLHKGKAAENVPYFQLYELKESGFVKVEVAPYDEPIRRVPGM